MADPTEVEELDDDEGQAPARKNWRKELTGRAEQAEQRAAELERKLAFTEAGLNGLSAKQVKALLATHEGDVTAEAFKATAKDLGFQVKAKAAEAESETDPEQEQRDAEVSELSRFNGAPQSTGSAVMSQEEIDAKIASFGPNIKAMQEWMYANMELFGHTGS